MKGSKAGFAGLLIAVIVVFGAAGYFGASLVLGDKDNTEDLAANTAEAQEQNPEEKAGTEDSDAKAEDSSDTKEKEEEAKKAEEEAKKKEEAKKAEEEAKKKEEEKKAEEEAKKKADEEAKKKADEEAKKAEEAKKKEEEAKKKAEEEANRQKVRCDYNAVRIRKGPGTDSAETGKFKNAGDEFYITEIQMGAGSNSGWGKLESGEGWVSMDFMTVQ